MFNFFFLEEKETKNSRLHFYVDLLRSLKTKAIQIPFAEILNIIERFVQPMDPQHKK